MEGKASQEVLRPLLVVSRRCRRLEPGGPEAVAVAARELVAVRQESRWPSGVRVTHAGSWRSGRTRPTSTTGTGEGQRARPRERSARPGLRVPGTSVGTKLRPGAALPGDGAGFFFWQGSLVPGPSTHHHLPLFLCLEGKGATGRAAPRGGVPEMRAHNLLADASSLSGDMLPTRGRRNQRDPHCRGLCGGDAGLGSGLRVWNCSSAVYG